MVCQNCHSSDIVNIQGQYYCINCGQLVTSRPDVVAATPTPPSPKLPPLEVPKDLKNVLIVNHAKPTAMKSAPSTIPIPKVETKKVQITPPQQTTKVSSPQIQKPISRPASQTKPAMSSKRLSDIRRPSPRKVSTPPKIEAHPTVEKMAAQKGKIEHANSKPSVEKIPRKHSSNLYWASAMQALDTRLFKIAVPAPVLVAVALGAMMIGVSLSNQYIASFGMLYKLTISLLASQPVNLVVPIMLGSFTVIILIYLIARWSRATIIFGVNKLLDNRSVSPKSWRKAGYRRLSGLVTIDLLGVFLSILLALFGISVLRLISAVPDNGNYLTLVLSFLSNLVIVYFWLGITTSRQIGYCAVTVGGLRPLAASTLGWKIYFAGFSQLVSTWFASVTITLGAVAAVCWSGYQIITLQGNLDFIYGLIAILVWCAVAAYLLTLALSYSSIIWAASFRRAALAYLPQKASSLFSGSVPRSSKSFVMVALCAILLLGVSGLVGYRYENWLIELLPSL